jgi:hypothetical protein
MGDRQSKPGNRNSTLAPGGYSDHNKAAIIEDPGEFGKLEYRESKVESPE